MQRAKAVLQSESGLPLQATFRLGLGLALGVAVDVV